MFVRLRIVILLIIISLSISCNNNSRIRSYSVTAIDSTRISNINSSGFLYGIPVDSFDLVTGNIPRNGFLSTILLKHGITMQEIDQITRNSSAVFDVRNIRSGNDYTVFLSRDTNSRAKYLVYEHDASTCFVFSFNDSLNITRYKKEIIRTVKYASATIETSLWDALKKDGINPVVTMSLSDIYAWTIDFFGLQKGDSFKVIYEELSIDEKSLGIGKVYGACFTGGGKTIYAIPFIQDGVESYYDAEGNSLRKAFLKAPLQFSRISSRFSSGRMHPILRIRRPHYGVDYAAPVGTPVHSIGDGRVTQAGIEGGSGRFVKITHNSVYSTAYLHLSRFGQGIRAGSVVKQGDIIGYVGSSGLSTGPHLDFRFYRNGSPVDPLQVEAPPVEPVLQENKPKFEKSKRVILSLLDTF